MTQTLIYMLVFNEERHVSAAIESILNQSYRNFHLLISSNLSTDRSDIIINQYLTDKRISKIAPSHYLTGIEHALWVEDYISTNFNNFDFIINIGGHDIWSFDYLKTLVLGMEENQKAIVVYTDTFEIDDSNNITRKHNNHIVTTEIIKPLRPLHVLVGLTHNTIFGGLWRQSLKSKIKIIHKCMGVDHFMIAEAALLGDVVYKFGGQIGLRKAVGAGDWSMYIKKHLGLEEILVEDGIKDFKKQLDWAISLQKRAVEGSHFYENPVILNSLLVAVISGYVNRYWPNLNAFGALKDYHKLEEIKMVNSLIHQTVIHYEKFLQSNSTIP